MYIREYEAELGTPWKNYDNYVKNSMPFLYADKIITPTLFMCGEKDFNVPLLNSEQMYQAYLPVVMFRTEFTGKRLLQLEQAVWQL
jgi:hypothetical protein